MGDKSVETFSVRSVLSIMFAFRYFINTFRLFSWIFFIFSVPSLFTFSGFRCRKRNHHEKKLCSRMTALEKRQNNPCSNAIYFEF